MGGLGHVGRSSKAFSIFLHGMLLMEGETGNMLKTFDFVRTC